MKRIISLALIALFATWSPACKDKTESESKKETVAASDVPAGVTSSFKAKYPGATDVIWEDAKEGDKKTYKAKFMMNGQKMKVEFGEDGTFIKVDDD